MASYDRKFAILWPTLDRLNPQPLEVTDKRLLDPTNGAVVPLIDGEFVQEDATYKYIRAATFTRPCYAMIEWRGDPGIQASRKVAALKGGTYEADTIVFDTAIVTLGAALDAGAVNNANSGSVARAGLIAHGAGPIVGYVTRTAAANGGLLRFLQVLV